MKKHFLKCWLEEFDAIVAGKKRFDLRKNDRDYQVGDVLILAKYDQYKKKFLPGYVAVEVTYVVDSKFGMKDGYCAMSFTGVAQATQEMKDYYLLMIGLATNAHASKN
ncbi:DUF3850 domain-containing protein [Spirosoma aerolatum]|uniref:DUF3850 domain-containing protein n=1 Tax=Spirosoma aerolatum TaxID=1211326 RepID=UPI0009ACE26A|nr:DUF3850 domain-containing protein [Spirosoma aerolatum]